MNDKNFTYTVKCKTCRKSFEVVLFESHEKNLFLAAKKDWFCDNCKKDYFKTQTEQRTEKQKSAGFGELTGTAKMVSWAVKIREDILKKVDYLKSSLKLDTTEAEDRSDKAFDMLFSQWQAETQAKWWIDHRTMNVRDISRQVEENLKILQEEEN